MTGILASAARLMVITASVSLIGCGGEVPDSGPPWVTVASNSQIRVSVDTSRLMHEEDASWLWLRSDFAEPDLSPDRNIPFIRSETRVGVDCSSRRAQETQVLTFGLSGEEVGRYEAPLQWRTFSEHPFSALLPSICEQILN